MTNVAIKSNIDPSGNQCDQEEQEATSYQPLNWAGDWKPGQPGETTKTSWSMGALRMLLGYTLHLTILVRELPAVWSLSELHHQGCHCSGPWVSPAGQRQW